MSKDLQRKETAIMAALDELAVINTIPSVKHPAQAHPVLEELALYPASGPGLDPGSAITAMNCGEMAADCAVYVVLNLLMLCLLGDYDLELAALESTVFLGKALGHIQDALSAQREMN